jgi:flagellar assembly protein FliH
MSSSAPQRQLHPEALPFAYVDAGLPSGGSPGGGSDSSQSADELHRRQQAEAFEQGRQSAQQQLRSEVDAAQAKNRGEINSALREFTLERQNYYRRVEGEIVELALAIARKILHREVQIDPDALAGIVRITLAKLDIGTKVVLRVHPQQAADWRRYFASQEEDPPSAEIREDASIASGGCRIETSLGSTEIGLQSQLKEIETGLLDLLAERPESAARSSETISAASSRTTAAVAAPTTAGGNAGGTLR